ncbi:unnamed protein product [Soboliphyme baturini]|uniref:NOL1/NOP2/Sun domain family member 4 n=1 Tax=Soboliphyme baturini TaxID=241478 RepID=A0A183J312_9BILA|nr:unnamed protein product [Soboliphyme baturini]
MTHSLAGGLVCNDLMESRINRLRRTMNFYIPADAAIRNTVVLTRKDATSNEWDEHDSYDKVLVDVPCTTDRLSSQDASAELFKRNRTKDRLQLPERQMKILYAGLRSVRPGGSVVYSTCTLSPIQNDGVVEATLNLVAKLGQMKVVVKDLSELRNDFIRAEVFYFDRSCKYGQLILPNLTNNFGPTYVCKLERIK